MAHPVSARIGTRSTDRALYYRSDVIPMGSEKKNKNNNSNKNKGKKKNESAENETTVRTVDGRKRVIIYYARVLLYALSPFHLNG